MPGVSTNMLMPGVSTNMQMRGVSTPSMPGVSTNMQMPGVSTNMLMPGVSTNMLMPGLSTNMLMPGVSTPSMPGVSTNMQMPGVSTNIQMPGVSTNIQMPGVSTPSMLGVSTNMLMPSVSTNMTGISTNMLMPSVSTNMVGVSTNMAGVSIPGISKLLVQPVSIVTLDIPVSAGSTKIDITPPVGTVIGSIVLIKDNINSEVSTVVGFGSILLNKPLVNSYSKGSQIFIYSSNVNISEVLEQSKKNNNATQIGGNSQRELNAFNNSTIYGSALSRSYQKDYNSR
jgi:hypothetical protein